MEALLQDVSAVGKGGLAGTTMLTSTRGLARASKAFGVLSSVYLWKEHTMLRSEKHSLCSTASF